MEYGYHKLLTAVTDGHRYAGQSSENVEVQVTFILTKCKKQERLQHLILKARPWSSDT
jgi:hypothetical protein